MRNCLGWETFQELVVRHVNLSVFFVPSALAIKVVHKTRTPWTTGRQVQDLVSWGANKKNPTGKS